ncbi:MAG: L(+)-tartrate dehydratase subunit alpha [Syntrophaceae bacterium PtaU1.Bin231]|nr:MAG: L(+)-tartrate dehydratase subunit alpha [Syntrophaceae bacterium PtaU1.Bin231]HOG16526.1 fumarate hydratase [Syntrophales bacterium]
MNDRETATLFEEVGYRLLCLSAKVLPADVTAAIREAAERERSVTARAQLQAILENIDVACRDDLGICQDTGVPLFFVSWGLKSGLLTDIRAPLAEAVKRATKDVPLRPNVIHPLTLENPGTNVGWGMPHVYWDVDPGSDVIEILAVPKGFGAEAKSSLAFVVTSEDMEKALIRCVLDNVLMAQGEACAPNIIGVCMGGTGDIALHMAKKAVFRSPVGALHKDPSLASLERKILEAVNDTGIGPMGLGGDTTALAVHLEICGTHTAVAPVGICFQCWANRYAAARIFPDGRVVYLTHEVLS